MILNETICAKGELVVTHLDKDNNVKRTEKFKNLVVTVGKTYIASRVTSNDTPIMSHMAIGSDATAPALADIALGQELARVSMMSFAATNSTVVGTAVFTAGIGTGALVEAGMFNASNSGMMLCRTSFPVFNKEPGDSIAINWAVTFA